MDCGFLKISISETPWNHQLGSLLQSHKGSQIFFSRFPFMTIPVFCHILCILFQDEPRFTELLHCLRDLLSFHFMLFSSQANEVGVITHISQMWQMKFRSGMLNIVGWPGIWTFNLWLNALCYVQIRPPQEKPKDVADYLSPYVNSGVHRVLYCIKLSRLGGWAFITLMRTGFIL